MSITRSIYDGPGRNYSRTRDGDPIKTDKRYLVIHNTSNNASAENEADYAKRRTDSVSSHYYVDGKRIKQSLDTDWRAWHVGSDEGNDRGISYEITGSNGKSRSWWLANVAWGPMVAQMRHDCAEHHIVPRLLTVAQIRAGDLTGIITHDQARRAWGGTTHTDPGPGFPLGYLVDLVRGASPSVSPSGAPDPTLREGDEGPRVAQLQRALNDTIGAGLDVDGDFGPATAAAVRVLQERAGLTRDEIYGPATARALADLLEDDMDLDDKLHVTDYTTRTWGREELDVETALSHTYTYARNASDYASAARTEQAKQTALLQQIAAGQSGLSEEAIAAAVESGVKAAIDPTELAAAVAGAVDHDLDTAAVEAALRRVLGGVDEAA